MFRFFEKGAKAMREIMPSRLEISNAAELVFVLSSIDADEYRLLKTFKRHAAVYKRCKHGHRFASSLGPFSV